ncbi:MAG TPA: cyclase family protein [Candidatus Omnitrophota bacterium]|nr:cyclase family protein [Candidatus Omnitrophota bacterium]HPT07042.1 cyclase family protein [Candidatus Omnitrophota bacterium]
MKIVDLSLPIDERAPEVHPMWIDRLGHKEGVRHINWVMMKHTLKGKIEFFLGKRIIEPSHLPDGEFLSLETVHCPVHIGTHIDFSFHYGTQSQGRPSKPIIELPLEWCYADAVVLNFTHKKPGEVISKDDVVQALVKVKYAIKPNDIVLLHTGADQYFGTREYLTNYPGVSPEAIAYILDHNVHIIGVDSLGFDRPYKYMMADFHKTKDGSVLWPAHFYGRKQEYAHIERLTNLGKLPAHGFKIQCFPIKILDCGAAWSRVVAFV